MLLKEKMVVPSKTAFKVQEVCSLIGIKSYVLRFWETEFEQISPIVSSEGQKLYERKDMEVIGLVKKLLFDDKMSIEQAKVEVDRIYTGLIIGESFVPGVLQEDSVAPIIFQADSIDFEKLDLAKNTLFNLLNQVDDIKNKYHWS